MQQSKSNVPPPSFRLRFDAHGFPTAIEYDGWDILHLPLSERNSKFAAAIVEGMNGNWDNLNAKLYHLIVEKEKMEESSGSPDLTEPKIVQCDRCGDNVKRTDEDVVYIHPSYYCKQCADWVYKNGCHFACHSCSKTIWGIPHLHYINHFCDECYKEIRIQDDLMDYRLDVKTNALIEYVDELNIKIQNLDARIRALEKKES